MPRPKCCRHVGCVPDKNYFKPRGIPSSQLDEVVLSLDEYEAIRLADYEELYQEKAAARMNISRQTFGRIIESAHKKIADVLINGKALKIAGGEVSVGETKHAKCPECHKAFGRKGESTREKICPYCRKINKLS
ncbi:MAG: hypothetical protein CVU52_06860 [Deltaproteobacteria bacterium HGW-Deltaproteobacteria-10]|nr:MAG: hypothetical protein CVU52_06860 [Deltaproteobacteria bacterium HGW-Deltaproteobacteria-10]